MSNYVYCIWYVYFCNFACFYLWIVSQFSLLRLRRYILINLEFNCITIVWDLSLCIIKSKEDNRKSILIHNHIVHMVIINKNNNNRHLYCAVYLGNSILRRTRKNRKNEKVWMSAIVPSTGMVLHHSLARLYILLSIRKLSF